jgi:hypothetical protein
MDIILFVLLAGGAGYAVSIYTWPRLRQTLIGIESEIGNLRARARALEARLRG